MFRYQIKAKSGNYCIITKEVKLFNNLFHKKFGFIPRFAIYDSRDLDINKLQLRFHDCIITKEVATNRANYVKMLKDMYPDYSINDLENIGFRIKQFNEY